MYDEKTLTLCREPKLSQVSFSVSTLEDTKIPDPTAFEARMEIFDICKVIHGAVHPEVGFRIDGCGKLRGLYEIETQPHSLISNYVTMDNFLPVIRKREYSMPDFYCLVITLVSSVLQLGETPWLNMPWNRQNIVFLRLEAGNHSAVDIKYPYLTHWYNIGKNPGRLPSISHSGTLTSLQMLQGRPARKKTRHKINKTCSHSPSCYWNSTLGCRLRVFGKLRTWGRMGSRTPSLI